MAMTSVNAQLTVAREHALLGDYTSAMVYYAGVLAQLDRYVHLYLCVLSRMQSRCHKPLSAFA